jgi:Protein of unknown function (DUF2997)
LSKTIEIVVAPDGQTRVETRGFNGSECRQASQFIERALGRQTGESLKAEFYQTASSQEHVQEGR